MLRYLYIVLIFNCLAITSQELPPIINFPPEIYKAGNQNWAITQDKNNFIYIANNDGLLQYNGSNWNLYASQNNSIIRSIASQDNNIYTGCYMDFGSWEKKENGQLIYSSILKNLNIPIVEDEQFWNIITQNEYVFFQSFNRIIIYNSNTKKLEGIIKARYSITKLFKTNNQIIYQDLNEGLFQIINGKSEIFNDNPLFKEQLIINVFKRNNKYIIITESKGIYYLQDKTITPCIINLNEMFNGLKIYSAIAINNNQIVLGTISNGVFILDNEVSISNAFNKKSGLTDNTALSLFQDQLLNIWVGQNDGIDCINLDSKFLLYKDPEGVLGTTYASIVYENKLYIGTNQGLFYKNLNSNDSLTKIKGTEGQVWSLQIIDQKLFVGHHLGTFLIVNNTIKQISKEPGAWMLKAIPGQENWILQGNYQGLFLLEKNNENWDLKNKIEGFDISAKNFEFINANKIIVNHEYRGAYVIEINLDYSKATNVSQNASAIKSKNSSIVKFNNEILYACDKGIFKYLETKNQFYKDTILSNIFKKDPYISGKLIVDKSGSLWVFSKNYLNEVISNNVVNKYRIYSTFLSPLHRSGLKGYETISEIEENKYLIGTGEGYIIFNKGSNTTNTFNLALTEISVLAQDTITLLPLNNTYKNRIDKASVIAFQWSIPEYRKFIDIEYSYLLEGNINSWSWSEWTTNNSKSFENLDYGDYTFKVRAKVNNEILESHLNYSFTITTPWYLKNEAIILYVILGFISIVFINYFYKLYYNKKQKKFEDQKNKEIKLNELAAQQEIMKLKNEGLNQDIISKNKELAISTMNMVNKNNLLQSIKNSLSKLDNQDQVKSVIKLIDKNLSNKEEWKYFESVFNEADKDFFKKVKKLHPSLTSNDLRLCVYLRLNLSSKEIAPLLNISPRSVEIKRYRLRKKINLEAGDNLNEYFIAL